MKSCFSDREMMAKLSRGRGPAMDRLYQDRAVIVELCAGVLSFFLLLFFPLSIFFP